jgi:hypothetical protein
MLNTNVKPPHLDWLVDTGKKLNTACGTEVDVLELNHTQDDAVLSAWAKHFRNQYCSDDEIDFSRDGMGKNRKEYLEEIKFPCKVNKPGPSIRAGDFAEILLADYLEWVLKFWVPRVRWDRKVIRNESSKGCDVIGFHFSKGDEVNPNDILAIIESKASLATKKTNLLHTAITHSAKDEMRKAESLNYIKQRLMDIKNIKDATKIARFQNPIDNPYIEQYVAAAVFSEPSYCESSIQATNAIQHPHHAKLKMIIVKGNDLMSFVHTLYQRAADEA